MKYNFLLKAEPLMLLADVLHNVLLSKGKLQNNKISHAGCTNINKRFDDAFNRLCRCVDFRAKKADKVLKCKIASIIAPDGDKVVYINILPMHKKSKKEKSYNK